MTFQAELDAAFADVAALAGEPFLYAGAQYTGIFAGNRLATQMLAGNYNTESTIYLRAHKSQFATPPAQRAGPVRRLADNSTWSVFEVDPNDTTHYVFTLKKPQPA